MLNTVTFLHYSWKRGHVNLIIVPDGINQIQKQSQYMVHIALATFEGALYYFNVWVRRV